MLCYIAYTAGYAVGYAVCYAAGDAVGYVYLAVNAIDPIIVF